MKIIAFLTGFSSLALQLVWHKYLIPVLGNSHISVMSIIAVFFLGFSIGPYILTRLNEHQTKHAFIIVLVSLISFSLASPWCINYFNGFYVLIYLLIPCTLMGMILPFCYEYSGGEIGKCYGFFSLGGVTATSLTTFVLMGKITLFTQIVLSVALLGASLAIFLRNKLTSISFENDFIKPVVRKIEIVTIYFLIGFYSLALELLWVRLIFINHYYTSFSYGLVVTIYISAFTLGLFFSSRVKKSLSFYQSLFLLSLICSHLLYLTGTLSNLGVVLFSVCLVFPTTFFMGAITPLLYEEFNLGNSWFKSSSRLSVYGAAGPVLGVLLFGIICAEYGTKTALVVILVPILLTSLVISLKEKSTQLKICLLLFCLFSGFIGTKDIHQVYKDRLYATPSLLIEDEYGIWGIDFSDSKYLLRHNVLIEKTFPINHRTTPMRHTFIPLAFNPDIKRILYVGLGLGIGASSILKLDSLEKLKVVEISKASIEISTAFWHDMDSPFENKKFEVIHADARKYISDSREEYDYILSGAVSTSMKGSTHLYSYEYWKEIKAKLSQDGILRQWLPVEQNVLSLMKTFRTVFPTSFLMKYKDGYDLLGFKTKNKEEIVHKIRGNYKNCSQCSVYFKTPEDLLEVLYDIKKIENYSVPLNRDTLPVVEYSKVNDYKKIKRLINNIVKPII